LRPEQVDAVSEAGGRLIVMPHAGHTVIRRAKVRDLPCIPGFATPTEAFGAILAGADALKLFPAEGSSPSVLKALRAVVPHDTPVIPVGGIDETCLESWLRAGAAGFGSALRFTDRVSNHLSCATVRTNSSPPCKRLRPRYRAIAPLLRRAVSSKMNLESVIKKSRGASTLRRRFR
jgi:2-keto-3-deoxy-6-phosphogluconate aldolase